jgi:hypothetical protein
LHCLSLLSPHQAILNTLLSKVHIKKKAGFKPTEKTGGGATAQIQSALMHRLTSLTKRFNQATLPQLYQPQVAPAGERLREAPGDQCLSCVRPANALPVALLEYCEQFAVLGFW